METCLPTSKPNRSSLPTFEPVTLEEAKKQLDIADGVAHHDAEILRLIVEAREHVEHDTGIVACTGTFVYRMTEFVGDWFAIPDVRPITAITSITYTDTAGATATFSSGDYVLDTNGVKQFVRLGYGKSWPTLRGDVNGITVTFVAGYATQATIPMAFKHAVLLKLTGNFENRQGVADWAGYDRQIAMLNRSSYP